MQTRLQLHTNKPRNTQQSKGMLVQALLLEHNVRFGDPECQGLMSRLDSDLLPALLAACRGGLQDVTLSWSDQVHPFHGLCFPFIAFAPFRPVACFSGGSQRGGSFFLIFHAEREYVQVVSPLA